MARLINNQANKCRRMSISRYKFPVFILDAVLVCDPPLCRDTPRILSKILQSVFILVSFHVETIDCKDIEKI